jgi:hypothetical protein
LNEAGRHRQAGRHRIRKASRRGKARASPKGLAIFPSLVSYPTLTDMKGEFLGCGELTRKDQVCLLTMCTGMNMLQLHGAVGVEKGA